MSCGKQLNIRDIGIDEGQNDRKFEFGVRHIQAIMTFFAFTTAYCVRTSMSVAVLALTDKTREADGIKIYDWDKKTQDFILSSFFTGYVLMQIPGGQLALRYGGNKLMSFSLLINGVVSLLLPTILYMTDWKGAYACRVVQGLSQSIMLASIHTIIGKWAPLYERNRFGLFIYSGCNIGTIVGMFGSGKLASTSMGWPLIFYSVGLLSLLCGSIMLIVGAESPAEHKSISDKEVKMIQESLNQTGSLKKRKTPWKHIIRSGPLMALQIVHIGSAWGFLLMLAETPSFFKMALGINVENSAMISALPPLVTWVVAISLSWLVDWLINKKVWSVITIKKIFTTIGMWGAAAALVGVSFVNPSQVNLAIFLVVSISALDCVAATGFMLVHIDLSPTYAGVLISISNFFAIAVSNLAPITVGYILTDETNITQWRLVFLTAAGFYFFTNIVFVFFGKSERQFWDAENENEDEQKYEGLLMKNNKDLRKEQNSP